MTRPIQGRSCVPACGVADESGVTQAMQDVEIAQIPPLKPNERSLLEMHGLLNVLNVLRGELSLIGLAVASDDGLLRRSQSLCQRLIVSLRAVDGGLATARQTDAYEHEVMREVEEVLRRHPAKRADPEIAESLANLVAVFEVLRVRARELLARAQHPEQWLLLSAEQVQRAVQEFLTVTEQHSRRRFGFVYNQAAQGVNDYYVDLRIGAEGGGPLWMPAVMQEVLRDLVANARKYTAPGGRIQVALHSDDSHLRIAVEDNGRGIPPDELAEVVHFGRRASNVADVRTMGGGFGLTRAFLVAKQFGGRFWLGSELGHGTRVRLEIPVACGKPQPAPAQSDAGIGQPADAALAR